MNENNQAADSSLADQPGPGTAAFLQAIRNCRESDVEPFQGRFTDEVDFRIMAARDRVCYDKAMDRLMNSRLDREKLPEDTPLPIYLAYKEPRSVSPPSKWDKLPTKKQKIS
ncbi:uncharacterized protein LOC123037441 [Drosophila rhopaloa]|uniref:Uncharacterized protein n=1 Tax=Drosophila rhopaloa TaxID=1041015 RepID=A0ABM5J5D8_DRORH|nr:uncharacterized protein LOC123037441 [Drosophila rhopaloa]